MSEAEARRVYTATKSTIDRVQTGTAEAIAAVPEIVNSKPSCVGQADCNLQTLSFQQRRNDALTALRAGAFVAAMREPGVVGLRAVMDSAETTNELVGEAGRTPPATRNSGRREANKGLLMAKTSGGTISSLAAKALLVSKSFGKRGCPRAS